MQKIFFGGILVYFTSVLLGPGLFATKLFAIFRDLITMGLISQFFSFFKTNKLVFFIMLAVLIGAFQFKGKSYLQTTFSSLETTAASEIELDAAGELLVEINENKSLADIQDILSKYNLNQQTAFTPQNALQTDLDDYLLIDIPNTQINQLEEIMEAFKANDAVDAVEYNELFKINPLPARKTLPSNKKYGINDPDINKLWSFEVLKMDKLYQTLKTVKPKKKAKIFIVDSGVDAKHEDLKERYRSIKKAYDVDSNGHGTHCAGIAAAITNNGVGIASVFPSNEFAEISGIKVVNVFGLIAQQKLISGIIEAVDNGADVISVSIGGRSRDAAQKAFQEVVDYANEANAIIVVAAGNSNENATDYTPANSPGVITVSAIDTLSNKASFSNMVGDLEMGIAAPGVEIYSTFPGSKYTSLNGTSMACPQVSGLVGLLKSIRPELTSKEVYSILKATGKKTGDTKNTGLLIQPDKAVRAVMALQ